MLDKTKFNQNLIPLDKQQKEKIIAILEEYYERIDKLLQDLPANEKIMQKSDMDYIDGHLLASYLLAIGEGYDYLIDKEHWLTNAYNILLYFKKNIENYYYLSLFYGLTDFAFGIFSIVVNYNEFAKFLTSLNKIICEIVHKQISDIKNAGTKVAYYDVILGMAGVGRYLLLYIEIFGSSQDCTYEKNALTGILKYFVKLSSDIIVDKKNIINFYVSKEKQQIDERKKRYPNGSLDFGVAHGMAGPLAVMAYSAAQNIIVYGQQTAINKINELYDIHAELYNNILYWPLILPFEKYKKHNVALKGARMSWCYGSLGISCILYKSNECLGLNSITYLNNIKLISQSSPETFGLVSPTICHGYSGALDIFNQIYKKSHSNELLNGIQYCLNNILNLHNSKFKHGFKDVNYRNNICLETEDDLYLSGSTGVILSLLSLFNPNSLHEKHLLIS